MQVGTWSSRTSCKQQTVHTGPSTPRLLEALFEAVGMLLPHIDPMDQQRLPRASCRLQELTAAASQELRLPASLRLDFLAGTQPLSTWEISPILSACRALLNPKAGRASPHLDQDQTTSLQQSAGQLRFVQATDTAVQGRRGERAADTAWGAAIWEYSGRLDADPHM